MVAGAPLTALAKHSTLACEPCSQVDERDVPQPFPKQQPSARKEPDWRANRERLDAMSLGIEMTLSVALGWYLGHLFDGHFETSPWGMIFFLVAGFGAAARSVVRVYKTAKRVMSRKEPHELAQAELERVAASKREA